MDLSAYQSADSERSDFGFMQALLQKAADFRRAQPDGSIASFGQWLSEEVGAAPQDDNAVPAAVNTAGVPESIETQIARQIVYMYRFARGYGKKLLHGQPLSSIDDVPYLLMLMFRGPSGKMALIQANLHEKTTGMEIIKRLTRLGLMEQGSDPSDGRQRLMRLTEAGQRLVLELLADLESFGRLVCGPLNDAEKNRLLHSLNRLYGFHLELHEKAKNRSWKELVG